MPSPKLFSNWLSLLVITAFALFAALLAWKFHYWVSDTPVFTYLADYNNEADAALTRASTGDVFGLYGGEVAPLMMPFALLVRIPALFIAHGFDFISANYYMKVTPSTIEDYVLRYKIGAISSMVFGGVVVGMSLWAKNRQAVITSLIAIIAVLFSPLTDDALKWGHPEEFLGAALVFAGIVVLLRQWDKKYVISAVLFGLSFAVKQPFWLLAPALLFVFPKDFRVKGVVIAAATFAFVSLPFIGPHLIEMFTQQTSQVGASTSTGSSHDLKQNLWIVFGLEGLSGFGRPLILLAALLLPIVVAWRSNWKLSIVQFAAVAAAVLILRSMLDYFNIDYYLLPGLLALMAFEYVAWAEGKHPLRKIAVLQYIHLPVLSLVFGLLMSGLTVGWAARILDKQNIGELAPYFYVIIGFVVSVFCIMTALGVKVELTRQRKALYSFVVVAFMAFLVVTSINNSAAGDERRIEPPAGYKDTAVANVQKETQKSGGTYWLGAQRIDNKYLRLVAYRPSSLSKGFYSVVDYGDESDTNSITVFTSSKNSLFSKSVKKALTTCTPQCPSAAAGSAASVVRVNTSKGPALVKNQTATRTRSTSQIEIRMLINGQAVFITAWNSNADAQEIISKLHLISPDEVADAQSALDSLSPAIKIEG